MYSMELLISVTVLADLVGKFVIFKVYLAKLLLVKKVRQIAGSILASVVKQVFYVHL